MQQCSTCRTLFHSHTNMSISSVVSNLLSFFYILKLATIQREYATQTRNANLTFPKPTSCISKSINCRLFPYLKIYVLTTRHKDRDRQTHTHIVSCKWLKRSNDKAEFYYVDAVVTRLPLHTSCCSKPPVESVMWCRLKPGSFSVCCIQCNSSLQTS